MQHVVKYGLCDPRRVRLVRVAAAWGGLLTAFGAHAAEPTAEMWRPVRELASFMSELPAGHHPTMLARSGLCIVENFAPFLFCGPGAARLWEEGFRRHAAQDDLSGLQARFGEPMDFSENGRRVYFSLPTTWVGLTHGKPFEEHGAWAFVLERGAAGWRIEGYGWGVTAYQEGP